MKVWVEVLSDRVIVHGDDERWNFWGKVRLLDSFNFVNSNGFEIVDPPETSAVPSLADAPPAAPDVVHFAGGVGQPAACGDVVRLWTGRREVVTCPLCLTGVKRRPAAPSAAPSSAESESVALSLAEAVASLADAAAVLSDRLSATLAAESASPVGREWVPSQEPA